MLSSYFELKKSLRDLLTITIEVVNKQELSNMLEAIKEILGIDNSRYEDEEKYFEYYPEPSEVDNSTDLDPTTEIPEAASVVAHNRKSPMGKEKK